MMEMPCVCVRCWRSSERRAVAAVSSAVEGVIVSKVVASAVQQRERRSGVVVDNHVTVTDSRHPALRMAPAPLRAANARVRAVHAATARVCGSRVSGAGL
jgi:hypothetical protein